MKNYTLMCLTGMGLTEYGWVPNEKVKEYQTECSDIGIGCGRADNIEIQTFGSKSEVVRSYNNWIPILWYSERVNSAKGSVSAARQIPRYVLENEFRGLLVF